ncbi:MAG TPA: YgaP-like transmembrane domain, partial [Planctomycetota bacterium]|nr:YgaP-like transmembrane domain [Planctomycetota bacterium]
MISRKEPCEADACASPPWEQSADEPKRRARPINIATAERWGSVAAGAALAAFGISRRSLPGALLALAGGSLIYRGAAGHCYVYDSL